MLTLILFLAQDRGQFDRWLERLDSQSIDRREEAEKALSEMDGVEAWVEEELGKADGELKDRLKVILAAQKAKSCLKRMTEAGVPVAKHPREFRGIASADPADRVTAIGELSPLVAPRYLAIVLEEALRDSVTLEVKTAVCDALTRHPHPAMVRPLKILLRDPEAKVRKWALNAVEAVTLNCTPLAAELLAFLFDSDVAPDLSLLSCVDWTDSLDDLLAALRKLDSKRREEVLPHIRISLWIAAGLLGDPDPGIRRHAVRQFLGRGLRKPEALESLMKDPDDSVRLWATVALIDRVPTETLRSLLDGEAREFALREFARRGGPDAVEIVKAELKDGRAEAVELAAILGEPSLLDFVRPYSKQSFYWKSYLERLPPDLVKPLLRWDGEGDLFVRVAGDEALRDIAKRAESKDETERIAVAWPSSWSLESRRARPMLHRLAEDPSPAVRKAVAFRMDDGSDPKSVDLMLSLAAEGACRGGHSLERRVFPRDDRRLRALVESSDPGIVIAALECLQAAGAADFVAARVKTLSLAEILHMRTSGRTPDLPGLLDRVRELTRDMKGPNLQLYDPLLAHLGDAEAAKRMAIHLLDGEIHARSFPRIGVPPLHLLEPELRKATIEAAILLMRAVGQPWDLANFARREPEAAARIVLPKPWPTIPDPPDPLLERAKLGDTRIAAEFVDSLRCRRLYDEWEGLEALAMAGSKEALDYVRARFRGWGDSFAVRILARLGDSEAIAWLRADDELDSATVLLELGLAENPFALLSRLEWARISDAAPFLRALNRVVDPERYDRLIALRNPGREVDDYPKALAEILGVPVKVDASVRETPKVIGTNRAFSCPDEVAPVFEGEGITLYSWEAARRVWERRLKRD